MLTIMISVALALWLLGLLWIARIPRLRASAIETRSPTGSAPRSSATTSVSVIIPARDEASNLPRVLASLGRQTQPPLEVLVADDGSTDGTAAVARAYGARVVTVPPRPDTWQGKTWPAYVAAEAAQGDLLVFLDADTWLEPAALEQMVATQRAEAKGGIVTVEPAHVVGHPVEALSLVFNIVRAGSVGAFTIFGHDLRPRGAFGPCLVVARDDYFATQGHGHPEVRDKVLESFHLGRIIDRAGRPVRNYGGLGVVSFRMYPGGFRELVGGWAKAFASGAGATWWPLLLMASLWLSGAALAIVTLAVAVVSGSLVAVLAALGVYALYAGQIASLAARLGRFPLWTALAYPAPLLLFFSVFAYSVFLVRWRRQVTWRGRTVSVGP